MKYLCSIYHVLPEDSMISVFIVLYLGNKVKFFKCVFINSDWQCRLRSCIVEFDSPSTWQCREKHSKGLLLPHILLGMSGMHGHDHSLPWPFLTAVFLASSLEGWGNIFWVYRGGLLSACYKSDWFSVFLSCSENPLCLSIHLFDFMLSPRKLRVRRMTQTCWFSCCFPWCD